MTTTPQPYPGCKPSGVEWLGDVPRHWEVVQLGRIGVFSKGSGGTKDDEVSDGIPCVRYGDLYTTHTHFIRRTRSFVSPARARAYTPINRGDVLFPTSGETIEDIGKSAVNLMHTQVFCGGDLIVFRPMVPMEPKFAGYSLDCHSAQTQKSLMGRGITIMHVYSAQLKYFRLPLPPLSEQAAIVRYLDHVDRRIRRYVTAKRKLIDLLEEEKQAVVNQAVTRGLDPNVRLKPSGAEWLGDVPEHWEIPRLRNLGDALIGLTYDPQDVVNEEAGILVLRASNVLDGKLVYGDNVFVRSAVPDKLVTREGDILICSRSGSRALIGKNARINAESAGTTFGAFMNVFRGANNDYLHLVFNSKFFEYQSAAFFTSTINQLTLGILYGMKVPFPPLEERQLILQYVEETTEPIIKAIAYTRRQIELVQEYRTRLIGDVVTGKLDVSEAAALLPDEADDEEPMDESGPLANSVAEDLYDPDKLAMESEVTA